MLKVGITGSIGSGKTTVCKLFNLLGVPIYYADDAAKRLMVENINLKKEINKLFDGKAYFETGDLNRKYIAKIVFNDKQKLDQLNALVHPAVFTDTQEWERRQTSTYSMKEAAILIESGSHKTLDKIIVVDAPLEVRLARVMKRDSVKREDVLKRESKQMSPIEKLKFADYSILNHDTDLVKQVLKIHLSLLQESLKFKS